MIRNSSSARRAAMKNRLRGNFIWRELGLQVGAPFIKASDDSENNSGSEHQPGEKGKVLIRTDLLSATCVQDPFIDEADEEFARCDSQKPQCHARDRRNANTARGRDYWRYQSEYSQPHCIPSRKQDRQPRHS